MFHQHGFHSEASQGNRNDPTAAGVSSERAVLSPDRVLASGLSSLALGLSSLALGLTSLCSLV